MILSLSILILFIGFVIYDIIKVNRLSKLYNDKISNLEKDLTNAYLEIDKLNKADVDLKTLSNVIANENMMIKNEIHRTNDAIKTMNNGFTVAASYNL